MKTRQKVELALQAAKEIVAAREHYRTTGMVRDLPYDLLTPEEQAIVDADVACSEDE